jgi:hypothetical protein
LAEHAEKGGECPSNPFKGPIPQFSVLGFQSLDLLFQFPEPRQRRCRRKGGRACALIVAASFGRWPAVEPGGETVDFQHVGRQTRIPKHIVCRKLIAARVSQHVRQPQLERRLQFRVTMVANEYTAPVRLFLQHVGTAQEVVIELLKNPVLVVAAEADDL